MADTPWAMLLAWMDAGITCYIIICQFKRKRHMDKGALDITDTFDDYKVQKTIIVMPTCLSDVILNLPNNTEEILRLYKKIFMEMRSVHFELNQPLWYIMDNNASTILVVGVVVVVGGGGGNGGNDNGGMVMVVVTL